MFVSKNRPFSHRCFCGKSSHKMSFFYILNTKGSFLDRNSKFWKKSKKSKIFNGVSSWYLTKNLHFSHRCFCGKSSHKISFFDILDRKEWFLYRNSKVWKKFKKLKICKGVTPWFLSKNRPFSHMFFFGKSSHKISFFDILDGK